MLENRRILTNLGNDKHSFNVRKDCPQGGVLSPLLWCLVVDDLINELEHCGFEVQGYADDLVITVRGKFLHTISDRMQYALNLITRWCEGNGLSVNPVKTEMILFTRRTKRINLDIINFKVYGSLRLVRLSTLGSSWTAS